MAGWGRGELLLGSLMALVDDEGAGDYLPTLGDLNRAHGVAQATVTNVLSEASEVGIAANVRGQRTRVVERPVHRAGGDRLRPSLRETNQAGYFHDAGDRKVRVELMQVGRVPCPSPAALRLACEPGGHVLLRYRRYSIDGEPTQLAWSYVPLELADAIPSLWEKDTGTGGMYARFAEHGRAPVTAVEETRARIPNFVENDLLDITTHEPVLAVWRTMLDQDGRAVEAVRITLRAYSTVMVATYDLAD